MIYIMTWHRGTNYGSVLQAYALQKCISDAGYSCRILDYAPGKTESLKMKIMNGSLMDTIVYKLNERAAKNLGDQAGQSAGAFDSFRKEYMDITKRCRNAGDIIRLCGDDAVFVCGSDQIWNPYFYDPCYFLTFVKDKSKKIAYAPSFGVSAVKGGAKKKIAAALLDFDSISVREDTGRKIVKDLAGKDAYVAADPTMLIGINEWNRIAVRPKEKDRYLFCYFLKCDRKYIKAAEKIAKARNLKIRMLPMTALSVPDKNVIKRPVGPREWLGYIKSADYVITDSFHCTLFAMRYRKQFTVLKRFSDGDPRGQNERISSFLEETGLAGRFTDAPDMTVTEPDITDPAFVQACEAADRKAERSKKWLIQNLEKTRRA